MAHGGQNLAQLGGQVLLAAPPYVGRPSARPSRQTVNQFTDGENSWPFFDFVGTLQHWLCLPFVAKEASC